MIYIDTSEFVRGNFDFANSRFATVVSRVAAGQVEVGLPLITKREVVSQIDKAVQDAHQAIAKARSGARVLRNLDDDFSRSFFHDLDQDSHRGRLIANLNTFLSDVKAIELGFDGVETAGVFQLYFARKAPFGDGKKKSEFPDAFILAILSEWAEQNQQDVFVASSDPDLKAGVGTFSRLHYVGSLEHLLDRVAREFDEWAPAAEIALRKLESAIEKALCDQFEHRGFFIEDQAGEVLETRALEAPFEASLLHLRDLSFNVGEATFEVVGTVRFEAELAYDDLATATYDREDKLYHVFRTIDETVDGCTAFHATLIVTFSLSDADDCKFKVTWDFPEDVGIASSAGELSRFK